MPSAPEQYVYAAPGAIPARCGKVTRPQRKAPVGPQRSATAQPQTYAPVTYAPQPAAPATMPVIYAAARLRPRRPPNPHRLRPAASSERSSAVRPSSARYLLSPRCRPIRPAPRSRNRMQPAVDPAPGYAPSSQGDMSANYPIDPRYDRQVVAYRAEEGPARSSSIRRTNFSIWSRVAVKRCATASA